MLGLKKIRDLMKSELEVSENTEKKSDVRVTHFTHTDIGGNVCGVLGNLAFENIDTRYLSSGKIDDAICGFLALENGLDNCDFLLISDIHLKESTLSMIDGFMAAYPDKNVLYVTHLEDFIKYKEQYSWIVAEQEFDGIKQDSVAILFRVLQEEVFLEATPKLTELMEKARRYTTWSWVNCLEGKPDEVAGNLGQLCHNESSEFFVEKLINKVIYDMPLLDGEDIAKIHYIENRYIKYLEDKKAEIIFSNIMHMRVGVVFAEDYINKLGSDLLECYKNLDAIVILASLGKISVRARGNRTSDAGVIARYFGGGGKPKSGGATLSVPVREDVVRYLIESAKVNI